MLTVDQLNEIRERVRKELAVRDAGIRLVVGVGTPGLAAGAREVMLAALDECERLGLQLSVVGQDIPAAAGQLPLVKLVPVTGEERLYTRVSPAQVREIVRQLAEQRHTAADA